MKVKAILLILGVIVVVICLPKQGQAYVGPPYSLDPLGYPSEHPWQHDDSPKPGDDPVYLTCDLVSFPINLSIQAIQLIRKANDANRLDGGPNRLQSNQIQEPNPLDKR